MEQVVMSGVLAVSIVVGLVEIAKREGLPGKHAPLAAVVCGVAVSMSQVLKAAVPETGPVIDGVLLGVGVGLAAAGLYRGGQAVASK